MTIINAYEQLFAEGYLEGKTGAGTYVASKLPEELLEIPKATRRKTAENLVAARSLNISSQGKWLNKTRARAIGVRIADCGTGFEITNYKSISLFFTRWLVHWLN